MINAIIFSKDRASQLHLLLDSISRNAPGIFNISILYKSSNDNFTLAYEKLMDENIIENITWVSEQDFKAQNLRLLESDLPYTCFFTDDDIIYQPIDERQIIDCLENDDDVFCFSLRLGKNIQFCYTQNSGNVLVPLEENDDIVKWDWTLHYFDFGYPLAVDGHIFRTDDIKTLSNKIPYTNPNTFEIALQIFDNFPKIKMAAFVHSKLVNNPINIVQNVIHNRKGEIHGISVEELNKKFLSDEVIDFDTLDFNNIIGAHQEIKMNFVKKTQHDNKQHI